MQALLNSLILVLIPGLMLIRFGILTPLSLLHPKIRRWVWEKASSLGTLNPAYRRDAPDDHTGAASSNATMASVAGCGGPL
jgi:hypothetical protein